MCKPMPVCEDPENCATAPSDEEINRAIAEWIGEDGYLWENGKRLIERDFLGDSNVLADAKAKLRSEDCNPIRGWRYEYVVGWDGTNHNTEIFDKHSPNNFMHVGFGKDPDESRAFCLALYQMIQEEKKDGHENA